MFPLSALASETLDASFLKTEPYRKQKQIVDVSSVRTVHDLAIVKDAITNVMRVLGGITFEFTPRTVAQELLTARGRDSLKLPPLRNAVKRFGPRRVHNWSFCGDDGLAFDVIYTDLLREKKWIENFVFVKTDGIWQFDRHGEVNVPLACD